jgi:hypothetical protein
MATTVPDGLEAGGASLWRAVTAAHTLDACQSVLLLEACRAKDRLDRLQTTMGQLGSVTLSIDPALHDATANVLKQLLAALRLPDARGRRPQRRGTSRGVYRPR